MCYIYIITIITSILPCLFRISSCRRDISHSHNVLNLPKLSFVGPKLHRLYMDNTCNAISRTGVCVPEDVGLYGRTTYVYECLYTKDGRTQTGDEWEHEMVEEGKRMYNVRTKRKKMKKHITVDDEPDAGFKELIFPAPFNTTGMLLRDGEPYLVVSSWVPGISINNIHVLMDYTLGPVEHERFTDFKKMKEISSIPDLERYYETCEAVPPPFEQHQYSYNGTYNDLFNRMHTDGFDFLDQSYNVTRPPLIFLNMPKNTIVKQWERATFSSRRDPKNRLKYSRIQRAYRPLAHVDLRNISCIYKDGTLQLRLKLTHIPPPPDSNHVFKIPIAKDGIVTEPRVHPKEAAHGWMYNWHYFKEYDLEYDLSKMDHSEADANYVKPVFIDDMTPRQIGRFIREVDELEKKD